MSKFAGQKCQSCKEELKSEAVVVVCPECGAPYHEECFSREGKCVYEEQHGDENCFSSEAGTLDVQICGNCGKQNGRLDDVCVFCGKPLKQFRDEVNVFKKEAVISSFYPSDEENVGAIEAFIGSNTGYYENAFRRQHKFNFAAFFSPILFFFYRKMYVVGLLFTAGLSFILHEVFTQVKLFYLFLSNKGLLDAVDSAILSPLQFRNFLIENQIPVDEIAERVGFAFFMLVFMKFLAGFLANDIYRVHVLNSVKRCKAVYAEHFEKMLPVVGGTSFLSAVWALMGVFAFFGFFPFPNAI
ncbi:hypothetical protein FACS189481_2200 [Clostridia bacterium]|nr:hypothetical protein FACS189481_2200 [Clostridia bacterium]